jgi:hypothetical protein
MRLELHLTVPSHFKVRDYRPDLDDARSILSDVCRALDARSEFLLSGFGEQRWPVDVGTDLVVFLEQLPHALHLLKAGQTAQIDFYEQGIQRIVEWVPTGTACVATCRSFGACGRDPVVETMVTGDVIDMSSTALATFIEMLSQMAPELVDHPWIVEWREGTTPL